MLRHKAEADTPYLKCRQSLGSSNPEQCTKRDSMGTPTGETREDCVGAEVFLESLKGYPLWESPA